MKNVKLILEYDGSRYQGFKRRDSRKTISSKIQEAFFRATGEQIDVIAAVNTDTGVHAASQTVNFKTQAPLSPKEIMSLFNRTLPMDIAVTQAVLMPERFHAALNLKSCAYTFYIDMGQIPDVFRQKHCLHYPTALDIRAIEEAGRLLCGTHDFAAFSSVHTKKSTIRSLTGVELSTDNSGTKLELYLSANNFLHLMPQLIIGTLLDIGSGKRTAEDIHKILDGALPCSAPCPACGLFLSETNYI